ncbi:uncharacterized protein LOC128886058 [Hylaeus anthracinus]|uniref:uncharacterized protein LOC128886058 n=1 Tax=Hylaeus anthracinus TaxID=313031 RepID=UPI0023B9C829|nr:uncharacterized protein LOC128886058 [Hylaeus anthracinus]
MSESNSVKRDSLVLKEDKPLKEEKKLRNCCRCSIPYKLAAFCIITCLIFVMYWLIITPLLISAFRNYNANKTDRWSIARLVLYWATAFIIWLLIMLCLTLIWKRIESKQNRKIKLQSYGTNTSASLISVKYDSPQIVKFANVKKDDSSNDLISAKNQTESVYDEIDTNISDESRNIKRKNPKDLPPLVIHRRNSGNDIESPGTVNQKENIDKSDEDELKSGNEIIKRHRESMRDYLKLVTVTPDDSVDGKSPKGPLSPRELFFIDLIKEAEKAERVKANDSSEITPEKHLFPRDVFPSQKDVDSNIKSDKKKSVDSPSSTGPSTYFIANVESPKSEKTEVYLEINSDPELVKHQPVILNIDKAKFVSQENAKDSEKKNTEEEEVFVFEI